jgi:hypothetical protein
MRNSALLFTAILLSSFALAQQQSFPKVDLGVGFSFAQMHVSNSISTTWMNGFQLDGTYNLNRWMGLTGEFTGHYHCLTGCFWDSSFSRQKAFTFVAGPKFALRRSGRVVPWVHALGGVSNISYSDDSGTDLATTDFALVAGGGIDVKAGLVSIRAIQVDVLNHKVGTQRQNDLKIGVGVVVGLGRKSHLKGL